MKTLFFYPLPHLEKLAVGAFGANGPALWCQFLGWGGGGGGGGHKGPGPNDPPPRGIYMHSHMTPCLMLL